MSSICSRRRPVYAILYELPFPDRLNRSWIEQLRCQTSAMRRALSFMLSPCVEHIMSFLELDHSLVHVCLLLQRRPLDLGVPIIQRSIVRFLDDVRFGVRRDLRTVLLQYFWDNYVGRLSHQRGDALYWDMVCREMLDYLSSHSRCRLYNVRVSRFAEQLDTFTKPSYEFRRTRCSIARVPSWS